MEFLLGLATGYLLTWPALAIVLVVGFIFGYNEYRKTAVFFGLVAMVISYFFFEVSLQTLAILAVIYLVIGVIWSFWRYRSYVVKNVEVIKGLEEKYRQYRIDSLAPTANLDRITAWIIVWPFSLVEHLTGDIIDAVRALVTKFFRGVYYKIYTSLTAGLLPGDGKEDRA